MAVEQSSIISTGFNSTAILAVGNSTLTVRPLTRLTLEELASQSGVEMANISLNAGRVRVEVNPPAGGRASFSVQTNVATASVRGTVFELSPDRIRVIEGAVSFSSTTRPNERPVTVSAGQESMMDAQTGAPLTPMAAAEAASSPVIMPGEVTGIRPGGARVTPRGSLDMTITLTGEKN